MVTDILPPSFQRPFAVLVVLFVAGLVLATFAFAFSYMVSAKKSLGEPTLRQITVSGEGEITVQPDVALFTVSFVTQEARIAQAKDQNSIRSNAVIAFLKEKGVEEKDIKTVHYGTSPQYEQTPPCFTYPCPRAVPPKISGYEVRHTFEVKVRDMAKADDLLDGVVKNGANEVGQIRFTVDDEKAPENEAKKKAIEDAKTKAEAMAAQLGVRLGKVISFYDNGGDPIPYGADAPFKSVETREGAAPAQLAPGEQEVRASIAVTYEIW